MPPVSILMKPASGNCNMRCDYCFYCDEQENRNAKTLWNDGRTNAAEFD